MRGPQQYDALGSSLVMPKADPSSLIDLGKQAQIIANSKSNFKTRQ